MELNWFVVYAITARTVAILLLIFMVLPTAWKEYNKQWKQRGIFSKSFGFAPWLVALGLLILILSTIVLSIVPISYQFTRIDTDSVASQQNWSSLFTNTIILLNSIGWSMIYKKNKQ